MNEENEIRNQIEEGAQTDLQTREVLRRMETLRDVPPRDPARIAAARGAYLSEAHSLSAGASSETAGWLAGWLSSLFAPLGRKDRTSMLVKLAAAAMLVIVVIVGGASATAYAAQGSLPSEPLYGLKVGVEDLNLALANDAATRFELALKYINKRGDEMLALKAQGEPIEAPLMHRTQEQMTFALQQAAGMPDHEMGAALNQYRHSMMNQLQKMYQAKQMGAPDPEVEAAEVLFETHRQAAEGGLQEPTLFRQQLQSGNLYGQPEMPGPYGPPEENPPSEDTKGPGPGGKPEDPGPAEPGPAEKPPGGPEDDKGNPDAGTPQAPGGAQAPGNSGSPSANSGGKGGNGGKGNGGSTGGGGVGDGLWPLPTPTPTPTPFR
jgi:uncharacterized membrane protein YgcG